MPLRFGLAAGVFVLVLVFTVGTARPYAQTAHASQADEPVTVTYAGSYTETLQDLYLSGDKQGMPYHTIKQTVTWKFVWEGQLSTLEDGASLPWTSESLTGSISNTYDSGSGGTDCVDNSLTAVPSQTFGAGEISSPGPITFSIINPSYRSSCDGAGCPAPPVSSGPTYCDPGPSWNPDNGPETFPENGSQTLNSNGRNFSGTVQSSVAISGRSCQLGDADIAVTSTSSRKLASAAAGSSLTVDAAPTPQVALGIRPPALSFTATAKGGCQPYSYIWKRTKAPARASVTGRPSGPKLTVGLSCPSRRRDCFGEISYRVTVIDKANKRASKDVFIKWCRDRKTGLPTSGQPCTNQFTEKEWKALYEDLKARYEENHNWLGPAAAHLAQEGGAGLLGAEALAPVAGAAAGGVEVVLWGRSRQEWGKEYQLFTADPPGTPIDAVAVPTAVPAVNLPGCAAVGGPLAAKAEEACAHDRPLYAALTNATARANAILDALITTENRYGTAVRNNAQTAVSLQQAVMSILTVELGDALRLERGAALVLAKALHAQRLDGPYTRVQLLRWIDAIPRVHSFPPDIHRALNGMTPRQFAAQLRSDLARTPGNRFDLLAEVSKPVPSALSEAPTPVTASQASAIVGALRSQHLITAAAAGALSQAVAALAAAADPASVGSARAAFAQAASQATGAARTFLLAAARALSAG